MRCSKRRISDVVYRQLIVDATAKQDQQWQVAQVGMGTPGQHSHQARPTRRPIQIWVPDVRSDAFAAEARRWSVQLAVADRAGDDQDFVESVSIGLGEE